MTNLIGSLEGLEKLAYKILLIGFILARIGKRIRHR